MARDEAATLSLERYAPDAKGWVVAAQSLADSRQHAEITPLHLLVQGLERDSGILEVFRRAGVDVIELLSAAERALNTIPKSEEPAYLASSLLDLLGRAEREAERERASEVGARHLLNALSQEVRGPAGEILGGFGVAPGSLRPHLGALREARRDSAAVGDRDPIGAYTRDLVRQVRDGAVDPVIGRDAELRRLLTILERRHKSHPLLVGEPGVGKGAIVRALAQRMAGGDVPTTLAGSRLLEVELGSLVSGARLRADIETRLRRLTEAVGRRQGETILVVKNAEQLFAPAGAGSAIGDVLKPALGRGEVRVLGTTTPEGLRRIEDRDATLLRWLTPLAVDEPTKEFAVEILRGVAGRYEAHHGVIIADGAITAAVALAKRYVQDRFLPDSAIDLLDESAAALRVEVDGMPAEVDEAIRRLESVHAQIASLEGADDRQSNDTRQRLSEESDELEPRVRELRERVESRRGAVAALRTLSKELSAAREARERAKAGEDFARLGELEHSVIPDLEKRLSAAEQAARHSGVTEKTVALGEEHVAKTLAVWTGIPVQRMLEGEADKLMKMEPRLEQRVVGQSDAVRALARAVRRGRVGLRDPKRPIGSFLFLGPSGVGKTELAKALAEFLFDDEAALTRLDMSEFMERHMAQRLLGAPPGYADSERGGFLTEAVRRRPYSVLLFDEVEKAHQDVFNLLLQVLDDGRLTDGRGRLADFTNTVVIMTSNIGSERILETDPALFESDDGREALRDVLLDQLGAFFRPEFLNRIDDVIVFRSLTRDHLSRIVDIQIADVGRLLEPRSLSLSDAAKQHLVELGYDPALGARPLKRAILRHIQDPLAEALLAGDYAENAMIHVDLEGDELVFRDGVARESA